jgi:hypothetical protein
MKQTFHISIFSRLSMISGCISATGHLFPASSITPVSLLLMTLLNFKDIPQKPGLPENLRGNIIPKGAGKSDSINLSTSSQENSHI